MVGTVFVAEIDIIVGAAVGTGVCVVIGSEKDMG